MYDSEDITLPSPLNNYGQNEVEPINALAGSTNVIRPSSSSYQVDDRDALSQMRDLASKDPAYMEAYLQLLAERENTTNAQAWYEKMSGSQYQRAAEDLKKAGLNPYLALQALGGAGSGSVSPAGTWSTSPYANKVQQDKVKVDQDKLGLSIAGIMTSVLAMLLMLA